MKSHFSILWATLFLSIAIYSQEDFKILDNGQQKFEGFSNNQGLKHNSILAIGQDVKGYIWIGTFSGIYKYDGYQFKIYKNDPKNDKTLIENNIHAIKDDGAGSVWIGTKGGLCRYNKNTDSFLREITLVGQENSSLTIKDRIYSIFQDNNKVLWVGTELGLYRIKESTKYKNKFRVKRFTKNNHTNSIASNVVKDITQDHLGNIWVGTTKGLNLVKQNTDGSTTFLNYTTILEGEQQITDTHITKLAIDFTGNLWVGTINGLNQISYNTSGNSIKINTFYHNENNPDGLTENHITAICPDRNNTIWIGTRYEGISRYIKEKGTFENYSKNDALEYGLHSNEISSIYEDKNGVLWIGAIGGSLKKLDLQKKKIAHFKRIIGDPTSLSDNMINVIYEDSKEHLWIGTVNGGINKLTYLNEKPSFINYKQQFQSKNSLSSDNIFSFCEDNYGNFWAGTESNGLNFIHTSDDKDASTIKIKSYTVENSEGKLPSDNINTIFKDHLGDLWMGSFDGQGLMKFTPSSFNTELPKITQFKYDSDNDNSLNSNAVACIFEDSSHILWVGTNGGGIARIFRDENNNPLTFTRIKHDPDTLESLSNNNVFSFHEDAAGNLWIATFGGGLNKLSKEERSKDAPKFVLYNEKDGLPSDELYGILEDNRGNLWISSNNGITKFDPIAEIFTNFNVSDGLQSSNFRKLAYRKGQNGLLYFGGINGFNTFYPDGFKDNAIEPQIEIVDFKIFNESVGVDKTVLDKKILEKAISETDFIELTNDHNTFSFEFSALHYSSSDQNKYGYMLEGFDTDWTYTDANRRFASYSNLDAGNYTFKVKASNNDNLWSQHIKEVQIKVLPPWWKTWWAYALYGLLFLLLMLLFRKQIVINEEYQNKLTIEKMEKEKIKEINQMKLEFFTNISHEFKTPLTLILGPLQNIIKETSQNLKIQESLLLMERNAKQLYQLINQVMEFRSVESKELKLELSKSDLVDFCRQEVFSFKVLADEKDIHLSFECNANEFESQFDWDKLGKIMNNIISNSIKYTPENGLVKVTLTIPPNTGKKKPKSQKKNSIKIEVADTGIGIPKNQLALIFDRFYKIDAKDRSSSMGSGIGLAFTKSLVELFKGTISVKSGENSGSVFTVKLPINQKILTEDLLTSVVNKNKTVEIPSYKTNLIENEVKIPKEGYEEIAQPSLLIVEDNPDMQDFIKNSLKNEYHIITADDGEEALILALKEVPDIIISDVMMPHKDGIQLCDEIKRNHITNHIPLILLTARTSVEHRIEGLEVGADAYIPKPFHIEHLRATLHNLLEQRRVLKEKFSRLTIHEGVIEKETTKFEREFLEKIESIIEKNILNPQFGVVELGDALNFSRMQLYRKLKSISGMPANEFIREYRIKKAAQYIRETDMNISEIAFDVGFNNLSYFTKCFKKVYKVSPSAYSKQQKV